MVRRRRARGFTIIELMLAMALASIGLMGLLALQVTALRSNALSRNFAEASGIAQEEMEIVNETPYANLSSLVIGGCTLPANNPQTTPPTFTKPPTTQYAGMAQATFASMPYYYCIIVTPGTTSTFVEVAVRWTETTNAASVDHTIWLTSVRAP